MENVKAWIVSAAVATIVPTVAITLYFLISLVLVTLAGVAVGTEYQVLVSVFVVALLISALHVLFLGLPAVWLLQKFDRLRLWSFVVAGFLTGCFPMAVWSWPADDSKHRSSYSYWNGAEIVQAKVDGIPTMAGWVDYIQGVGFMGLLGVFSAISFWWTLKRISPNSVLR